MCNINWFLVILVFSQFRNTLECRCGKKKTVKIILGGEEVEQNEYPWIAVIKYFEPNSSYSNYSNGTISGGTLIHKKWVLTSGYIVYFNSFVSGNFEKPLTFDRSRYTVYLGAHDTSESGLLSAQPFSVRKIKVPSGFFANGSLNENLALLQLNKAVKVSVNIMPICLPFSLEELQTDDLVTIIGWGMANSLNYSSENPANNNIAVHEVDLQFIHQEDWNSTYPHLNGSNHLRNTYVFADADGKGHCLGDQGGSMMWKNPENNLHYLYGILYGYFGTENHPAGDVPSVATDVFKFLAWIRKSSTRLCKKKS